MKAADDEVYKYSLTYSQDYTVGTKKCLQAGCRRTSGGGREWGAIRMKLHKPEIIIENKTKVDENTLPW